MNDNSRVKIVSGMAIYKHRYIFLRFQQNFIDSNS